MLKAALRLSVLLCAVLAAFSVTAQHKHELDNKVDMTRAPLLTGVGTLNHPTSTKNEMAQKYFDQGIALIYAFNHLEAERAFAQAQQLDPDMAMAWWGQALALAPNINDPITPDRAGKAYAAIQTAIQKSKGKPAAERDYIKTLAKRYSANKDADRAKLDVGYAQAMGKLAKKHPNDPDAQVLYASALMETMPWDYYQANGDPKPAIVTVQKTLESAMKRWPNHTGAHHLYIHAVEASSTPDRGEPSADVLGGLAPTAGHLVHMPSHIYLRVGRWEDAAEANRKASKADEDYITQCRAQGIYPIAYYPHNLHMGSFAAAMQGGSEEAIGLAKKMKEKIPADVGDEMPYWGNVFTSVPILSMVRFGKWDELLAYPQPSEKLLASNAIWRYGQGVALIRAGKLDDAEKQLKEIGEIAKNPALKDQKMGNNDGQKLLTIAENILAGELAAARKDYASAVASLEKAVAAQDALHYNEPEDWYFPVRHVLGAVLLEAGRPADAEKVYVEDLKHHRKNGWALYGLAQALKAQGKSNEASKTEEQFTVAWKYADVRLTASKF
ncbi:MAG TPA: tetratricopeptide repeat protein [Terriglobales bacterium]|nr:tetratricopeptide repeat protein [Terriglobales bacterium]